MKLEFSAQAKAMIKTMKDFDERDFTEWFFKTLVIGGTQLAEYMVYKGEQNGNSK